ncbi:MAG: selenocysteine-specific translation elongation factor, partial [Proteobacteria bacterium]|nr:selenocysteine-specific translation elongation factor [Pseudomonadota bacterium]
MIVGTAGHIDHGKTALVRALTGVDTDRLPEEKARGITIDLGYAYAPLDGAAADAPVGFVDVPGHEQLVRTMVAGATGIDCALLVVAADDGVMPQTREHVAILALLGIARGALAITKVDLVDADRIAAVTRDVRALVADTSLATAPCFEVSALRGDGVPALRAWLTAAAAHAVRRRRDEDGFRLAVDRSFTLAGAGTVVTGSVHSGRAGKGAHLTLAPALRPVRVRDLHAQNRPAANTSAGERSALNLADVARTDVSRGDWVVDDDVALATTRIDAVCRALPGAEGALRSGASVHLFVGAAHVTARVVVLREGAQDALVQFVLAAPLAAWRGDRFIVRDAADARTLGGGTVLDPLGPARYRRTPARLAMLDALAIPDADARLAQVLAIAADGVDLARHARAEARHAGALRLPDGTRRVTHGALDVALTPAAWARLADVIDARLVTFHAQHPDEMGPDLRRLHRIALPRAAADLVAALVDDALARGTLKRTGPWLHKPDHDNRLSAAERALF